MVKKIDLLNFSKSNTREFILYFFIFFPYITTFFLKIDTSVYALIYSSYIIIFIKNLKLPIELISLFILSLASLLLLFVSGIDYFSIRITAGYFSVFIISSATYYILKKQARVNTKLIYVFLLIWFFVGLIQLFFDPTFLTSFISRSTTTIGRGVAGLAPEPTYYATVALFFFLISFILNYNIKKIFILTFSITILFSKSATVLLLFLIIYIFYMLIFILNKHIIRVAFISLIGFLILIYNFELFQGSRFYKLSLFLIEDPIYLFVHDASGNARLWNIFGAFIGSYENYFLPNLYGSYANSLSVIMEKYPDYVHPYSVSIIGNKIMSGTGQIFYDFGFFGFFYIYIFFTLSKKYFKNIKKALFLTLSVFTVMTTAISIAFPMFAFLYGLLAFKVYEIKNSTNVYY
jgi:hypothetical protein